MKSPDPNRRTSLPPTIQLMNVIDAVCDESVEDYEDNEAETTRMPWENDEQLSAVRAQLVKFAKRCPVNPPRKRKDKPSASAGEGGPKLVEPLHTQEPETEEIEVTTDTFKNKPRS